MIKPCKILILVLAMLLALVLHGQHKVMALGPNGMAGQGILGVPYLVEDCDDFQAIDEDLTAYYQLQNDIDCSDTVNWNGGEGFRPIGWDDNNTVREFSGNLDGQGYAVNDIYMDYSTEVRSRVGIFEQIGSGAKILNINFSGTSITGPLVNESTEVRVGGLAAVATGDSVVDIVRINSPVIDVPCPGSQGHRIIMGGMFGQFNGLMTRSFVASASITTANCPNQMLSSGGLAGQSNGAIIRDSWAGATMNHDSQSAFETEPRLVGGLVGFADGTEITRTYTQGVITMNHTVGDWQNWNVGGLLGASTSSQITNSFTRVGVQVDMSCTGSECDYGARNLGFMVGSNTTSEQYGGSYYDDTQFGQSAACDNQGSWSCTAVNTIGDPDPNYFFNQPTNPPMDHGTLLSTGVMAVWAVRQVFLEQKNPFHRLHTTYLLM